MTLLNCSTIPWAVVLDGVRRTDLNCSTILWAGVLDGVGRTDLNYSTMPCAGVLDGIKKKTRAESTLSSLCVPAMDITKPGLLPWFLTMIDYNLKLEREMKHFSLRLLLLEYLIPVS